MDRNGISFSGSCDFCGVLDVFERFQMSLVFVGFSDAWLRFLGAQV